MLADGGDQNPIDPSSMLVWDSRRMTDPSPADDDTAPKAVLSRARRQRSLRQRSSVRFRREERRELRYQLSVAVAVSLSWVAALTPRLLRNWLADRFGDLFFRLAPTYRENVLANVRQVLGAETPAEEPRRATQRIFRTSGRNFADLLRVPHISRDRLARSVPLVSGSWSMLDDALGQGRGVVLMTAHLGAFDYMGHNLAARGYPLTSVTGRTTSRFIFDAVTYLRRSHGAKIEEATPAGVRRVIHALRRGECVAFVVDYDFFQNGLPTEFFGRMTTLPPGPIRIARETGATVVGAFARRSADGFTLSLEEPFLVEKTNDLDADLARGMARAVAVLERAIGAAPDQWVMFQRVWPETPVDPVRVFPVGSPLESDLLRRVDDVLPGSRRVEFDDPPETAVPVDAPTDRTDPPPSR